jgi:hypothetical protein
MAYIKETNTNMNVEKKGGRKAPRFYRADLAGPVKITKADGSVEYQPAMTREELVAFLDKSEG